MATTEREITPLPEKEEDIQPSPLVFFCKKCKKLVAAKQTKKKFRFKCGECGSGEVAFGTEPSIKNHYRLKD